MGGIHFANPQWASLVWAVLGAVAVVFWLERRKHAALDRFLSPVMQPRLVRQVPRARRWLSLGLLGLCGAALVLALMRPQGAPAFQQLPRVGAQIMVCLDVSNSMLAEDTAPNRLERAKAELADLLAYLDGDQVGLIAFAGKATLLCPLTPDYGFFKLILDAAGPRSVGRGGTRLEEPLRKALAGFRAESDISRAILLVTDGEDHDSYPLTAAKEAAEHGVKIITIGFGDEAGAQVQVTDRENGVRSLLKDRDGRPVITRLDGETLREIAQVSEGAYVPAGTGAMDLESIYDAHIKPLTRGRLTDRGRAIRSEHFQWAVLAGLVLLVAAVAASSGPAGQGTELTPAVRKAARAATVIGLMAISSGAVGLIGRMPTARILAEQAPAPGSKLAASENSADPSASAGSKSAARTGPPAASSDSKSAASPADPRKIYNDALASLAANLDEAERRLSRAQREAGTDGELRYCATYNLGWVEVRRADQLLKENPEQSLVHLRAAAQWFQDAVRLRPERGDARHNLEVLLRRILELSDSLRKQGDADLPQRLDALVEAQRGMLAQTSGVVQQLAGEKDPNAAQRFRLDYRRLAVEQRKILSDSESLAKSSREEQESLQAKKQEERSPEEQLRSAQLSGVLHYAEQANQRMGQTRSHFRSQQGERAFRRASAALSELKRARDQLRHPVEILGVLVADAAQLAGFTNALAAATRSAVGLEKPATPPPVWLTREYLEETQQSIQERTGELASVLSAGLEQQATKPAGPPTVEQQAQQEEAQQFLEMLREAMPFIQQAHAAFGAAHEKLSANALDEAGQQQVAGIVTLEQARERFLDLRGLIEHAHANQSQVQALLAAPDDSAQQPAAEAVTAAKELQDENIERGARLEKLLNLERKKVPPAEKPTPGSKSQPNAGPSPQQQRLELAQQLWQLARSEMLLTRSALDRAVAAEEAKPTSQGEPPKPVPASPDETSSPLTDARTHGNLALEQLQALRRLFFSLVEHLRETAQRQSQLNDETEQAAATGEAEEQKSKAGLLSAKQHELQAISGEIAKAFKEQSQTPPQAAAAPPADPKQQEADKQMAEVLAKASELVAAGATELQQAMAALKAEPLVWKAARDRQNAGLAKLAEALALLVPPQPEDQNQPEQKKQEKEKQEKQQPAQTGADPARLLQAVRDREASRRKDKKQPGTEQEPVDKDW